MASSNSEEDPPTPTPTPPSTSWKEEDSSTTTTATPLSYSDMASRLEKILRDNQVLRNQKERATRESESFRTQALQQIQNFRTNITNKNITIKRLTKEIQQAQLKQATSKTSRPSQQQKRPKRPKGKPVTGPWWKRKYKTKTKWSKLPKKMVIIKLFHLLLHLLHLLHLLQYIIPKQNGCSKNWRPRKQNSLLQNHGWYK